MRGGASGLGVVGSAAAGLILGYGAGYEIIEAAAATLLSPDAGEAFLGLQGDPWDTHKDMFMAYRARSSRS